MNDIKARKLLDERTEQFINRSRIDYFFSILILSILIILAAISAFTHYSIYTLIPMFVLSCLYLYLGVRAWHKDYVVSNKLIQKLTTKAI